MFTNLMAPKLSILAFATLLLASCYTPRMAVPQRFASVADMMEVKGVNSLSFQRKLVFGPYYTSRVKRGWPSSGSAAGTPLSKGLCRY